MRGRPAVLVAAVAAVVAVIVLAFVAWPRGQAPPDVADLPEAALVPDLAPLLPDGKIRDADIAHDSRDDAYRQPFGAVPAGTEVTLRLRAAAGDLEEATIRVWDALAESQVLVTMQVVAREATGGEHG
jgi:hypothetical protein